MRTLTIITALLFSHPAEGLTCLKCDGVPQPRICNKVVECYDGESCSVEKMLNEFGEYVYNLGCLSDMVCGNFTSSVHAPTITCSECCKSTDLCNSKGCGEIGYPAERGPICYNCPLHTDTGRCHDIEFCSHGEVCNIVGKNVFSGVVYTSRCVSKHACKATGEGHVAIIGRRDIAMTKRTHEQHICDSCCEADVCNKNCTTARQIKDPCLSKPCIHGNCKSNGDNFNCECYVGYSGLRCENDIDECVSNPCVNGICNDSINGYSCSCHSGYSGLNCQQNIDECSSQPCVHGSCTDLVNAYNCTCFHGYRGLNCEIDIDECSPNPCATGTCIDGVGNYSCMCNYGFGERHCQHVFSDCFDILRYERNRIDGVYKIMTWKTGQNIEVFCDMNTDGGGWTVFQYRFDGSIDFYRNFSEYENGFGNLHTEFWLGLSYIEEIASQGNTDLRIDLEAADGTRGFETFDNFSLSIGPAYTLHLGSSIADSRISSEFQFGPYHNGSNFTTFDYDSDSYGSHNCAVEFHGAWWYNVCYEANLNGKYIQPGQFDYQAMNYKSFMQIHSLKSSKMMMRRK